MNTSIKYTKPRNYHCPNWDLLSLIRFRRSRFEFLMQQRAWASAERAYAAREERMRLSRINHRTEKSEKQKRKFTLNILNWIR